MTEFELGVGDQVLDHPQRHVHGGLGADREDTASALPSRISTTQISSSVLLPPRKYSGCAGRAGRDHVAQRAVQQEPACPDPCPSNGNDALQEAGSAAIMRRLPPRFGSSGSGLRVGDVGAIQRRPRRP